MTASNAKHPTIIQFLCVSLLNFSLIVHSISQSDYLSTISGERPSTSAIFIEQAPVMDGNIMNDEIWQSVVPFDNMIQKQPNAGSNSSEPTEIRIAFTQSTLYVSAVCYDKNPDKLVVSDARRDASLDNTDSFQFIFDTYKDGQNGFVFGTNSIGIEYDAQVDNEGKGNFNANRQQSGTIGGFNLNWDASWEVKTEVGEYGWSAEFAIPLKTLRFASGENQTWGINFQRNIRKTNEICFWAPLPIDFDIKRVSFAGSLEGLNLQSPGNLKAIPYVLYQVAKDFTDIDPETNDDIEVGMDIKYSVTPSLTLDLTYNTDFAQVEVDEQQINLDRFNLFFPEKRPFFLENAGQFSVGSPGEIDLFFSRRIGIGDDGSVVPILGGARLSGKLNQTNIGFLSMFTEGVEESDIHKKNFTVARVNHEFRGRSSLGAVFVNKEDIGSDLDDAYNRTFAVDGKWGLGRKAQFSGFFAKTQSPGIEDDDHAFRLRGQYEWAGWNIFYAFSEVAPGFNPEVGFLLRQEFRKHEGLLFYRYRLSEDNKFGFLEVRPHVSYRGYWDFDGIQETGFLHVDNHWVWKSGLEIHTGINFTKEGVVEPFTISDGIVVPADTYDHKEAQIVFITNKSKNVYASTRHVWGGFFGGKRRSNRVTLGLRLGDKFNSEYSLTHNDVELPFGDFINYVFGARLSYSFTPSMALQSLIQYNSVIDRWSMNVRFNWISKANTGLFLVYNENRGDFGPENRSVTLKYSYFFDVLK